MATNIETCENQETVRLRFCRPEASNPFPAPETCECEDGASTEVALFCLLPPQTPPRNKAGEGFVLSMLPSLVWLQICHLLQLTHSSGVKRPEGSVGVKRLKIEECSVVLKD